jgi:hypothetical protein
MARFTSTHALVVLAGIAALAVAASSGAVAATQITGLQIKNGTVTGADLKDGTVASADIKNGGIAQADVAGGYLRSSRVVSRSVSLLDLPPGEARLVLTHPATGLQVRYVFAGSPSLRFTNTSSRPVSGSGLTYNASIGAVQSTQVDIPSGDVETVPGLGYGSYLFRQLRTPADASVVVTVTCARQDTTVSCTAVG